MDKLLLRDEVIPTGETVTLSVRISVLRQRLDQLIDHTATAWPAD